MRLAGDEGAVRREVRGLATAEAEVEAEGVALTGLEDREEDPDAPVERSDAARETPVLGVRWWPMTVRATCVLGGCGSGSALITLTWLGRTNTP